VVDGVVGFVLAWVVAGEEVGFGVLTGIMTWGCVGGLAHWESAVRYNQHLAKWFVK